MDHRLLIDDAKHLTGIVVIIWCEPIKFDVNLTSDRLVGNYLRTCRSVEKDTADL